MSEFFDVSVDYLVGISPVRKESDKKDFQYDIGKQMNVISEMLSTNGTVYFNGKELSPNEKCALGNFISGNIEMIKALMHDLKD